MPDYTSGVSERMENIAIKTTSATTKALLSLSKSLLEVLMSIASKEASKRKDGEIGETSIDRLKQLQKGVEGGVPLGKVSVADEDYELFKKHLEKQGVLFAAYDLMNDNTKMIIYLESEAEKVQNAIISMQAERGLVSEIDPSLMIRNAEIDKSELRLFNNLDPVELELFKHYAAESKLTFSVVQNGDKARVIFNKADITKALDVLSNVTWALTSEYGERIREQVEYRLAGKQERNIPFEDAQKEIYIVDSRNPANYFHVTSEKMTYYKYNKEVSSIERDRHDFREQYFSKINSLAEPVVLTPDEFSLSNKEKMRIIEKKTAVLPTDYDYLKMQEDAKERRRWEIRDNKYSLDNSYQLENSSDMENPDVSYSEFLANEVVNDQHETEEHNRASIEYAQKFDYIEVRRDKKHSLEYYIKEAEIQSSDYQETTSRSYEYNR